MKRNAELLRARTLSVPTERYGLHANKNRFGRQKESSSEHSLAIGKVNGIKK